MKKLILAIAGLLGLVAFIVARREVQRAEAEASLWAEATDSIE